MATTITKILLSGSTHAQPFGVTATQGATPTTVHQLSTSATTSIDEVYIYAHNDYSETIDLILQIGASTTNSLLRAAIPARDGTTLVTPGFLLTGSASGIYAQVNWNGTASTVASTTMVHLTGWVNRITQ